MATINGTQGSDTLTGTNDADVIYGYGGADTITGADGNDRLDGGDDNDLIDGGNGNDYIAGGAGNDEIWGGLGADRIDGGDGDDRIIVNIERGDNVGPTSDPIDYVFGGAGNDTIITHGSSAEEFPLPMIADGGIGDDTIQGGWGADTLLGGDGNDVISGRVGDDVIDGGAGNDDLTWGDVSFGGEGDAVLIGGTGNDVLKGGLLTPSMDGGDGDDVLILGRGSGNDAPPDLRGGLGMDTLGIASWGDGHFDLTATDTASLAGIERIDMDLGTITPNTAAVLTVDHDSVLGLSDETDTLIVDGGADDRVIALGSLTNTGTETIGDETYARYQLDDARLLVNTAIGTQPGESHSVVGTAGDDTLFGTAESDAMIGGAGSDTLFGGGGDDTLHGGNAGDFVEGDGGDVLDGGTGNDLLNGGAGPDTFVFAPGYGQDQIYWFENGIDKIDLRAFGFANLNDMQSTATTTEGTFDSGVSYVTFDFGGGDALTAIGLSLGGTDASDFLF